MDRHPDVFGLAVLHHLHAASDATQDDSGGARRHGRVIRLVARVLVAVVEHPTAGATTSEAEAADTAFVEDEDEAAVLGVLEQLLGEACELGDHRLALQPVGAAVRHG